MSWRVICADVMDGLAELADESVQCVVTSPPYWGLRDYGTASWDGGDPACDHLRQSDLSRLSSTLVGSTTTQGGKYAWGSTCGKCGAVRIDQQLGLEPTPEAYVERMVEVFREVRRVLRSDGTVWLNLGDSYGGAYTDRNDNDINRRNPNGPVTTRESRKLKDNPRGQSRALPIGLKPKDLVGIPWRVAFALQADGWWLRSDIIWAKPNPMPESVTDRPTKSHEYVFLLSKSSRYFYDADAVREPMSQLPHAPGNTHAAVRLSASNGHVEDPDRVWAASGQRNIRSVWNIATQPFAAAHFAVFPQALVVPCVKAGSATGDTVLDPFCGSGTTGVVALRLGRSFVGIELSETYAEMARNRITDDAPLWNVPSEVIA